MNWLSEPLGHCVWCQDSFLEQGEVLVLVDAQLAVLPLVPVVELAAALSAVADQAEAVPGSHAVLLLLLVAEPLIPLSAESDLLVVYGPALDTL